MSSSGKKLFSRNSVATLSSSEIAALKQEVGEINFLKLLALSHHATGSLMVRDIASEYHTTATQLHEMSENLSFLTPRERKAFEALQRRFDKFTDDMIDTTLDELLYRFQAAIEKQEARKQLRSQDGLLEASADMIEAMTWGWITRKQLLKGKE